MERIQAGLPVLDIASRHIGFVAAVTDEAFQVALLDGTTEWLSQEALLGVCSNTVALVCNADRMSRYAVARPSAA
jgi:hypothetical protein